MAKLEKKPKEPKKKKEKVKKQKAPKVKKSKETKTNENAGAADGDLELEIIPLRKAITIIFGCTAFAAAFLSAGVFAGITILKPNFNATQQPSSGTRRIPQENTVSPEVAFSRSIEALYGPVPGFPNYYWVSADSMVGKNDLVMGGGDVAMESMDGEIASSSHVAQVKAVDDNNEQKPKAQVVTAGESKPSVAKSSGTSEKLQDTTLVEEFTPLQEGNSSAAKETVSIPKESRDYLSVSADELIRMSQEMEVYISDSDAGSLRRLYHNLEDNAGEIFDYASESQANGLSDSISNSMYEMSSAYSILADGARYAATVLENSELFDSELINMTYESSREKMEKATGILR